MINTVIPAHFRHSRAGGNLGGNVSRLDPRLRGNDGMSFFSESISPPVFFTV